MSLAFEVDGFEDAWSVGKGKSEYSGLKIQVEISDKIGEESQKHLREEIA